MATPVEPVIPLDLEPEDIGMEFGADSASGDPHVMQRALALAGVGETPASADKKAASKDKIPLIDAFEGDDSVSLPGGLVVEGEVHRSARVRELTGEDEEHLARALMSKNPLRQSEVMVERGVERIGPFKMDDPKNRELFDKLCIGDRDMLLLAIRRATYGNEVEASVKCLDCRVVSKILIFLDKDIPVRPLKWDPSEVWHDVPLRRDRSAQVRLTNIKDQREVFAAASADPEEPTTAAESNTLLFSMVTRSINDKLVNGSQEMIRKLGVADRRTINQWLLDSMPGPQYDEVKHVCEPCGKEILIALTPGDLFPGTF